MAPEPTTARDAAKDSPLAGDGAETGIDTSPASMVTVTILDPAAVPGADGGVSDPPVVAKSDRLAPTVQVEVQSMGGDPTLDVVTQVKATIVSVSTKSPSGTISLNQTQYSVVPESNSKVYIYADTPFDLEQRRRRLLRPASCRHHAGGAVGTATLRIYIDGGPVITFLQPADGAYVKGSVVVHGHGRGQPVQHAGVSFPSASTRSILPPSRPTAPSTRPPSISAASIHPWTAQSNRHGHGHQRQRQHVDRHAQVHHRQRGPTISNTKPATGVLIGKLISIEAKVDDPAGVMDSSVIAVVANGDVHFEVNLVKGSDGIYQATVRHHASFPASPFSPAFPSVRRTCLAMNPRWGTSFPWTTRRP
jgi:hypothetical protein